jgi:hypothetical protein
MQSYSAQLAHSAMVPNKGLLLTVPRATPASPLQRPMPLGRLQQNIYLS